MSFDNLKQPKFIGLLFFTSTLILLVPSLSEVGVTWDEPEAHFKASDLVRVWLTKSVQRIRSGSWTGIFDPEFLKMYWPPSTGESQAHLGFNDHPPLSRYLTAITWSFFHKGFSDVTSYRLSSAFLFSALVATVFCVMAREAGYSCGVFAALSLILMPRVFGHAHIAATDMPITAFWFFTVIAFYKAIQRKGRWRYGFSVLLGLAWLVKFTGLLIPAALILYILICRDRRVWNAVNPAVWLSPLLLWVLNPTWWRNPVEVFYANFLKLFMNREEFTPQPTYYLGKTYWFDLPWHHSFVLTAATVPLTVLICALIGLGTNLKRWNQPSLITLFLWQLIWFYFVMVLPFTPNHDGVRLFLPVFPFWACFAGLGFKAVLDFVRRWICKRWKYQDPSHGSTILLTIFLLFPPAIHLAKIHPYYLESFNTLVGGVRGAHRLGFETTYWFDTFSREVREYINRLPDFSGVVVIPGHVNYFKFLKDRGLIKSTLAFNTTAGDYLIVIPRQGKFFDSVWETYRHSNPIYTASFDGVPLVLIYKWENT